MTDTQEYFKTSYFWTAKSKQKLPAVMASGHGLSARVHSVNAHQVSAQSDFSRAMLQTMQFLHPSRPEGLKTLSLFIEKKDKISCHLLNGVAPLFRQN